MTLYEELKAAGVEINNHYSDLYVPVTTQTTAILLKYPTHFNNAKRFIDNVSKKLSYDVPFAFMPYWDSIEIE
jgi:hypothetical protein